jgi:predicted pyridoxine 5'-phosphate oxidase superfamily flavin-nucleotide-binding protein
VGRAALSIDPDLIASFAVNGKSPCCVLVITVERVFYRCTKAIVRSNCGTRRVDRQSLPTTGAILAAQTAGRLGGDEHDRGQLERTMAKLY